MRRFQANNFDSIADDIHSVENLHPYIGFEVINKGDSLVWNFILPPATDLMNFITYQAVVNREDEGFRVTLTADDNEVGRHREVLSEKVERAEDVTNVILSMQEKIESVLAKAEDEEYLKALNKYVNVLDNFRMDRIRSESVDVYSDGLQTAFYLGGDKYLPVHLEGDTLWIDGEEAFSVKTDRGYINGKEFRDALSESLKEILK